MSTAGYALGYIGGGALLRLNLAWIQKPDWFGLPSGTNLSAPATLRFRLAFLSVAVWWLVFSIPLFRRVPEPAPRRARVEPPAVADPGGRRSTRRDRCVRLRRYRQAFLMLLAFLIYNDGIGTIMRMAARYGDEIGHRSGDDDRRDHARCSSSASRSRFSSGCSPAGSAPSVRSCSGSPVYTVICVVGYFMKTGTHFLVLAMLVGAGAGGNAALSRSLFASLIPRDKSGEFFGFFGVAEKFAGIFGPATSV